MNTTLLLIAEGDMSDRLRRGQQYDAATLREYSVRVLDDTLPGLSAAGLIARLGNKIVWMGEYNGVLGICADARYMALLAQDEARYATLP